LGLLAASSPVGTAAPAPRLGRLAGAAAHVAGDSLIGYPGKLRDPPGLLRRAAGDEQPHARQQVATHFTASPRGALRNPCAGGPWPPLHSVPPPHVFGVRTLLGEAVPCAQRERPAQLRARLPKAHRAGRGLSEGHLSLMGWEGRAFRYLWYCRDVAGAFVLLIPPHPHSCPRLLWAWAPPSAQHYTLELPSRGRARAARQLSHLRVPTCPLRRGSLQRRLAPARPSPLRVAQDTQLLERLLLLQ